MARGRDGEAASDPNGRLPAGTRRRHRTTAQEEAVAAVERTLSRLGRLDTIVVTASTAPC
jgi:hypothetical protein